MIVSHEILRCVAFVGLRLHDGEFLLYGSAFFLGYNEPGGTTTDKIYLVTSEHVIAKIRDTGVEHVCVRLNLKGGGARWYLTRLQDWFVHPTDDSIDVAILRCALGNGVDHISFPRITYLAGGSGPQFEYVLGDEVFIAGLFRWYHGVSRNIPIIRVGNVAAFVPSDVSAGAGVAIDEILIEARSIGGLSGSPVFLNLNTARLWNKPRPPAESIYIWLGIIRAHFAPRVTEIEDSADAVLDDERINSGIARVVPSHKIDAVTIAFEQQGGERLASPVAFFGDPGAVLPPFVAALQCVDTD